MSDVLPEFPPELHAIVRETSMDVGSRLAAQAPGLAPRVAEWIHSLSERGDEDYFVHPEAFPMLLLPWWLEMSLCSQADTSLQSQLVYASMCGYYFTRLVDDLMDRDRPPSPPVLPALIYFHTEFERPYQDLFPATNPFWTDFRKYSYEAADTASVDAALPFVTQDDFRNTSSRKVAGAKIALAAVCRYRDRTDELPGWVEMVDSLGRWHQMANDMVGWIGDLERDRPTYFLSHARQESSALGISVPEWVLRYGIDWGTDRLEASMGELVTTAGGLQSPPLLSYLVRRRDMSAQHWAKAKAALAGVAASG